MDRARLIQKFKPTNNFDFRGHILRILRIFWLFEALLIPLNCIANMSLKFHYHQILTYEFWSSDQVINSNIVTAIALLVIIPYVVYYEREKSAVVRDQYLTIIFLHSILIMLYNGKAQWKFVLFVAIAGGISSFIAYGLAVKKQQDEFIGLVSNLERSSRKPMDGIIHNEQHRTLVEPTDDFISIQTLK